MFQGKFSQTNTPMTSSLQKSFSPFSTEPPAEKKFKEETTGETMIISISGIFASRKGQDKYMQLQSPQQVLYKPFVQLVNKNLKTPKDERDSVNFANQFGASQLKQSPPPQFTQQNNLSPSQFLSNFGNQNGQKQIVDLNTSKIYQNNNGQIYILNRKSPPPGFASNGSNVSG
jgi:hypothetical protein